MVDQISKAQRSKNMAAVRSCDTVPEKIVQEALRKKRVSYRTHDKRFPGSPDLVIPRLRIAIFVHGCFWHGHSCPRGRRPKTNIVFWNTKIRGNMKRDRAAAAKLRRQGWKVRTIWQCTLGTGVKRLLRLIEGGPTR